MSLVVALDIGGTFTDLVAFDLATGSVVQAKDSTTPYDLSVGIRRTLEKSGLRIDRFDTFVHGSTVAINTAIERTGAKTALIMTEGTRDVYQIGRGNRPESYNFLFKRPQPLVPRRRTYEIVERLGAAGEVVVELDMRSVEAVVERLREQDVEATAVCLIHSWANPDHEIAVGETLHRLAPGLFHSLSHQILREYREYERTSTAVLNSYVGPRVSRYLKDFEDSARRRRIRWAVPDHAVEWRSDVARDGETAARRHDGVGPRRRHHRRVGGRPGAGRLQPHRVRHGRDDR